MLCKNCGEEYSSDLFPVCPFCLTENAQQLNVSECASIETSAPESVPDSHTNPVSDSANNVDKASEENNEKAVSIVIPNKSIADIPFLSMRTKNALRRNGIFTVEELRESVNNRSLFGLKHIGANSLEEIETTLLELDNESISNDDLLIADVFKDSRFNSFIQYCNDQGYVKLVDLQNIDLDSLSDIDGIGKAKVYDIRFYLLYYQIISCDDNKESETTGDQEESKDPIVVNEDIASFNLSFLYGLGVKKSSIKKLRSQGFRSIGDLSTITLTTLNSMISAEEYSLIVGILNKSLYDVFGSYLTKESLENNNYSIVLCRSNGMTLQEVADVIGLTRERVRQREALYLRELNVFMVPIVDRFINDKGYITIQEIIDIYDNDDFDKVLVYWCKHSKYVNYLSYAELFLPATVKIAPITQELQQIADEVIGDGVDLREKKDEILGLLESRNFYFITYDAFLEFLANNGYRLYKTYAFKGRQSYGYMCAKLIAKYFPNGIKLYDSTDLDRLRELALSEFGDIGLSDDNRALSARISDFTILSGRGAVTAAENIHVDLSMLEEIKAYIDSLPEAQVYYADIYAKFEGIITMMSNIDNYNFLHGVLKLYYAEEYDFSARDYLMKRGENLSHGKLTDQINEYVISTGRPVTKDEIRSRFPGVTDIVLSSAIISNPSLYLWDFRTYFSTDLLKITPPDLDSIIDVLEDELAANKGYCSDVVLFEHVSKELPDFLVENNIATYNNLFFTVSKLLCDTYDFRRPHICRKGLIDSIWFKTVALHLLGDPDVLEFTDYQALIKRNKWSTGTAFQAFYDIEQDYIRVSLTSYVKKDVFDISDKDIESVRATVLSNMEGHCLSLINFDSFDSFPEIGYEWNTFLLRSIVDNYIPSFEVIEVAIKDRRNERGIIVETTIGIHSYAELVSYYLKSSNIKEINASNLTSFLVVHDLAYRILPQELYQPNDYIDYKDGVFYVS